MRAPFDAVNASDCRARGDALEGPLTLMADANITPTGGASGTPRWRAVGAGAHGTTGRAPPPVDVAVETVSADDVLAGVAEQRAPKTTIPTIYEHAPYEQPSDGSEMFGSNLNHDCITCIFDLLPLDDLAALARTDRSSNAFLSFHMRWHREDWSAFVIQHEWRYMLERREYAREDAAAKAAAEPARVAMRYIHESTHNP